MKTKRIELLAPAKNSESGIAAISHGADAVYIAAQKFGAREAAGNSFSDIEKLIKYAHRYYAKVYLVLNTILYDNELEHAQSILKQAYNSGCDAAIVQDMGILEMNLPPIPLFASTQTHNLDIERIKFIESVGFQRIILARELSIQEIAFINANTNIDLEAFVHGALCVSYSGQCYISQAIAGRSANRGACAQICRLPYNIVNDKGKILAKQKHVLSLHDLNLSDHLENLLHAGVTSFKIEGRLKDITYVKNTTSLYRQKLDLILNKSVNNYTKASSGSTTHFFTPSAEKTFSRGFTTYFAYDRIKELASFNSPKSVGEYIGKVSKCGSNYIVIDKPNKLNNGDGICFIPYGEAMQGTRVNKIEGNKIYPLSMENISVGTNIYRNFDHELSRQLTNQDSAIRQIKTTISVAITESSIMLTATDEDNISASLQISYQADIARNADMAIQNIREQFSKAGNSLFKIVAVNIDADIAYFYPLSQLNAWRRELLDKLEETREKNYKQPQFTISPNSIPYPVPEVDYTANVSNKLAEQFYKRHGVTLIQNAFECNTDIEKATLMFNRYCVKYEMGICPQKQGGKPTGILYLEHKNKKFKLEFNCVRCEMKIVEIIKEN